jgi:hypothetical protein
MERQDTDAQMTNPRQPKEFKQHVTVYNILLIYKTKYLFMFYIKILNEDMNFHFVSTNTYILCDIALVIKLGNGNRAGKQTLSLCLGAQSVVRNAGIKKTL